VSNWICRRCAGFNYEAMQRVELLGDAIHVRFGRRFFDFPPQLLDGRESIAASGAFQVMAEAADGPKIA
jgi:hypothetical protein